jgi:hypothetical protein
MNGWMDGWTDGPSVRTYVGTVGFGLGGDSDRHYAALPSSFVDGGRLINQSLGGTVMYD